MKKSILATAVVLGLSACTQTVPIQMSIEDSTETFTGNALDFANRAGEIRVRSSTGATCKSNYVYRTKTEGEGKLFCTDGRKGAFTFTRSDDGVTGNGTLAGLPFTFTFG